MPKMKTHSSIKNRFKVTGTGKVTRYKQNRNHLLSHRSARAKRTLRGTFVMAKGDVARIKQMLFK
jgi:large subunit ribosomal protein L35